MAWKRYPHIVRHEKLPRGGRELIDREIFWSVKRDGKNVSFHLTEENGKPHVIISSRQHQLASEDIQRDVKAVSDYHKYRMIVIDHPSWVVYTEYIPEGYGPTKIEPYNETPSLILLDIWDWDEYRFLGYNALKKVSKEYNVELVEFLFTDIYESMDELKEGIEWLISMCKERDLEGVVGKVYYDSKYQTFFKEKTVLPKLPKKKEKKPSLPILPDDKVLTCLDRAKRECDEKGYRYIADLFMPIFSNYIEAECREHDYDTPPKLYYRYLDYIRNIDS